MLVLCGLAMEAGFLILARLGDLRLHLSIFLTIYAAQSALMILAWRLTPSPAGRRERVGVRAEDVPSSQPSPTFRGRRGLVIGFAVLFRLTLLPTLPSLSDDIYRYNWDG